MLRAVIYARYSSDHQREASIEDQLEVCRRYVERQGWTIVEVYADQALSGASRFRPAFQQMLADAEQRRFDVIVVEALEQALADPEIKAEAAEIVRSQIEQITLTPNAEDGGLAVELYGDLARILQLCESGGAQRQTPQNKCSGARIVGGCGGRI